MRKKMMAWMFVVTAVWCDFGGGEDLVAFLIDMPDGVKNEWQYKENICQFAADYLETHDLYTSYYVPQSEKKK